MWLAAAAVVYLFLICNKHSCFRSVGWIWSDLTWLEPFRGMFSQWSWQIADIKTYDRQIEKINRKTIFVHATWLLGLLNMIGGYVSSDTFIYPNCKQIAFHIWHQISLQLGRKHWKQLLSKKILTPKHIFGFYKLRQYMTNSFLWSCGEWYFIVLGSTYGNKIPPLIQNISIILSSSLILSNKLVP